MQCYMEKEIPYIDTMLTTIRSTQNISNFLMGESQFQHKILISPKESLNLNT